MSPVEHILILVLAGFAIYRQTRTSRVVREGRFKFAVIYAVIGLAEGGLSADPVGKVGTALLLGSFAVSVVFGLTRGLLTPIWESGGVVYRRGTVLTVGLFLLMLAIKIGVEVYAGFFGLSTGSGFGTTLIVIAVMVAFQAEIVYKRALKEYGVSEATSGPDQRTLHREEPV